MKWILALAVAAGVVAGGVGGSSGSVTAGVGPDLTLALDCDQSASGVQSSCDQVVGQPLTVDVVLTNNGASTLGLRSFAFEVHDPDTARVQAIASTACSATSGLSFGCNPNFQDGYVENGTWDCAPPTPDEDTGEDGPGTAVSLLQCTELNGFSFEGLDPGESLRLATARYTTPPGAAPGTTGLSLEDVLIKDGTLAEIGSCAPVVTVAMTCNGATLTINDFTLALDCDKVTAGLQSACVIPSGPLRDVDVVLTNNTATPRELNGFSFEVHDPDTTRLNPPPIACGPPCHSANPDPDQAILGLDFSCTPPPPDNDTGEDGPGTAVSFLSCTNAMLTGPTIPPGGNIVLALVRYAVPATAANGTVSLSLEDAVVMEDGTTELGSCAPVATTAMTCAPAAVTIARTSLLVDCNITQAGVQSTCHVSNMGPTARDVSFVARNNSTTAWTLGTFNFALVHPDESRLFAPHNGDEFNGNPDFTADSTGLADWSCAPLDPDNDMNDPPADPGQDSFISCFNAVQTGPVIAGGALLPLATVHYNIPAGADPGSEPLTLQDAAIADDTFTETGSCVPVVTVAAHCVDAEIIIYCPIDQADVNNDGRVNSIDLGMTASKFFVLPVQPQFDQNFDGVLNSIDLGLIASNFNKFVTQCP